MSILISQFFFRLQRHPRLVLLGTVLLTCVALIALRGVSWHVSLSALFDAPRDKATEELPLFSSTAQLTLVVEGENPAENRRFIHSLLDTLNRLPEVGFVAHRTDSSFIAQNYLLYFEIEELEEMRDRLEQLSRETAAQSHPMIVDLIRTDSDSEKQKDLRRLEKELLPEIRGELGSSDGKILLIHILPAAPLTDPKSAELFFSTVSALAEAVCPPSLTLHYTGDIAELAQIHNLLHQEMPRFAVWIVIAIVLLLLIFFFRQPLVPLIALVPVGISLIWILALSRVLIGTFTPLTLLLIVIFFSFGTGLIVTLLGRYEEERLKGLSPGLSLETVLLETGPAIVLGSLITSIGFFILIPIPFKGFSDFGKIGGGGTLLQLGALLGVFPSLLRYVQRHHPFHVEGKIRRNILPFEKRPLSCRSLVALGIPLGVLLLFTLRLGFPLTYEKGFVEMGLAAGEDRASELMRQIDLYGEAPVLIRAPDSVSALRIAEELSRKRGKQGLIHGQIFHTGQLLPRDQEAKLEIFGEIEEWLRSLPEGELSPLETRLVGKLKERLPRIPLSHESVPQELKQILDPDRLGFLVLLFSHFPPEDGMNAARFARTVDQVSEKWGGEASGKTLFLGRFVDQALSEMPWIQIFSLLLMLFLLVTEIGWRRAVAEVIVPAAAGIIPALTLLFWSESGINPVNVPLLPVIFGLTLHNVIQVQHRYREEGRGSLPFVLRTTGIQVLISTTIVLCVFIPFLFSEQQLLRSIGNAMVAGSLGSGVASLLAAPLLPGIGEYIRKRVKTES